MWRDALVLALREIRRNALRSFLTVLGIVIGVAAVITMVTVGGGATLVVATHNDRLAAAMQRTLRLVGGRLEDTTESPARRGGVGGGVA